MFNDSIRLKRSILESCPYFQLRTDLIDSHIYLFRNWILDYLQYETGIRSVKFDLLPSLVRKQFRRLNRSTESYDNDEQSKKSKRITDFIRTEKLEYYMAKINLEMNDNHEDESKLSLIKCGALVLDTGHLVRVNNLMGFCEANRFLVDQLKSTHLQHRGSLVGHDSKFGDQTLLKRTVIGNNCRIGDQCQLTNCIIQDDVTIENGCQLINSVVCAEAHIEGNVLLENCLVGPKYRVNEKNRYRNESLIQEMLDLI
ncbi:translation initiation factor eIF-2B subunit gamma-like protein [Euroglyphus maynei]|uniref:Translation initiation factor eIF2B subunit gamma n=1 Tax=Euroglyphus maynei TaxID=6958 RepID=A0A1Y3BNQ6_EURMA|nr:translation initiation factor eIF-2B subunit gamma-like protein [Euroglyphus maynei]